MSANLTLADRLERLFKSRPNEWLDGRLLGQVAGYAAWRTRVSELRRHRGLDVQNRVRIVRAADGTALFRVTEYRYRPSSLLDSAETQPQEATC